MRGTPGPSDISTKQRRIAELARQMSGKALTSLSHHINIDWLREAFRRTRKDGATGVDGQTAAEYEAKLEVNLQSLLDRAKSGTYRAPPVRRAHIPKGNGSETSVDRAPRGSQGLREAEPLVSCAGSRGACDLRGIVHQPSEPLPVGARRVTHSEPRAFGFLAATTSDAGSGVAGPERRFHRLASARSKLKEAILQRHMGAGSEWENRTPGAGTRAARVAPSLSAMSRDA